MSNQGLIWVCFEPREYPYPLILYGGPDPNWGKDVYVPYVPADRIEQLERERDKIAAEWAEVSQKNYQRAKAAEAKLTKAVEALREVVLADFLAVSFAPSRSAIPIARAALAELEGK